MKWNLTDEQRELTRLLNNLRMMVISNEEMAVTIIEAGFRKIKEEKK